MNAAQEYFNRIHEMMRVLAETQSAVIDRASMYCADALMSGHRLFISKRGSHALHHELHYRAGGLVGVESLSWDATELQLGDVVIIGTNAGFDASTVGLALRCRALGVRTIGITTVAFENSIRSTDASGKMLHEVVDVNVDQGGPSGDAVLHFSDIDVPIIPASGILGLTAAWMILAATSERMIAAGKPPLVYQAIQLDGASDRNAQQQAVAAGSGVNYVLTNSIGGARPSE